MKLFQLQPEKYDRQYCFVRGALPISISITLAEPAKSLLDDLGIDVLDVKMDEDTGGLELPDNVGNLKGMLLLRRACADRIRGEFAMGTHEWLPARLMNEKKRVHADDYGILNPVGREDCLDTSRSEMGGDPDDPAVRIFGKYWLDSKRVPSGRDVFRVVGVAPYIFTERLVRFIETEGWTNFSFTPVQVS